MWDVSDRDETIDDEYEKRARRENIVATALFLVFIFAVAALMGLLGAKVDPSKFIR